MQRIVCTQMTAAGKLSRGAGNQRHGKNKTAPFLRGKPHKLPPLRACGAVTAASQGLRCSPRRQPFRTARRTRGAPVLSQNTKQNKHLRAGRRTRGNYIPHSPAACITTPGYPAAGAPDARSALSVLSLCIDENDCADVINFNITAAGRLRKMPCNRIAPRNLRGDPGI